MSSANTLPPYRCPGQSYPISRPVHLGRLARFYPGCRDCPHGKDADALPARQARQWAEVRARVAGQPIFRDEGAEATGLNDLGPAEVRRIAAALGVCLRAESRFKLPSPPAPLPGTTKWSTGEGRLVVVLAGDGRPLTAPLVAAAGEGLRWSGCHLVDIGPATAPALAFTINHLSADGGLLLGNAEGTPHAAGVKFWGAGGRPLSKGGMLDRIEEIYHAGADRPTRRYGPLDRYQADVPYSATLTPYYHGLRPLRLVLDSASAPLVTYLQQLTAGLACRMVLAPGAGPRLGERVRVDNAHLGVQVRDNGEVCTLWDEQGRCVPSERLLLLMAREIIVADAANAAVVLEEEASPPVASWIAQLGCGIVRSHARRAAMDGAMREHGAVLGGGPSGQIWHLVTGQPLPDALWTITRLLVLLSRSDRPLSQVLDVDAAMH